MGKIAHFFLISQELLQAFCRAIFCSPSIKRADPQPAEDLKWESSMEPLMKMLISKKGVKIGEAAEIGRKKVSYIRGKDFMKFMTKSQAELPNKCQKALDRSQGVKAGLGIVPTSDGDQSPALKLGHQLILDGFIHRAVHEPLHVAKGGSGTTKKWPDRLKSMPNAPFEADGYYIIDYEGSQRVQKLILAFVMIGILLACMWPAWPIWAKIGMWYLCVVVLSFVFVLLIARMVVFFAFWILGFEFWILPNLLDDDLGVLESFVPGYSFEKRQDGPMTLLVRLACIAGVTLGMYHIGQAHSLADLADFMQSNLMDIVAWGEHTITALPESHRVALPSLADIEKETVTNVSDYDNVLDR